MQGQLANDKQSNTNVSTQNEMNKLEEYVMKRNSSVIEGMTLSLDSARREKKSNG